MLRFAYFSTSSNRRSRTYYDILGIPNDADQKEIKDAYRGLIRDIHPDKSFDDHRLQELHHNKVQEINEAYRTLINDEDRKSYNEYMGILSPNEEIKLQQEGKFDMNESHFEDISKQINQTAAYNSVQDAHTWFGVEQRRNRLNMEKLNRLSFEERKKMRHLKYLKPKQRGGGLLWVMIGFVGITTMVCMKWMRPKWEADHK